MRFEACNGFLVVSVVAWFFLYLLETLQIDVEQLLNENLAVAKDVSAFVDNFVIFSDHFSILLTGNLSKH